MVRRLVSGASLIAGGAWAVIVGAILNLADFWDELPRCSMETGGCAESALRFYWYANMVTTSTVVLGAMTVMLGVWFVVKKESSPER
ncbi:MAG TPA: hypothetical protein VKF15_04620 [Nitrososphaerales archaeon]|nr:hypothetical protein [Nitrososphaerales archaeon]